MFNIIPGSVQVDSDLDCAGTSDTGCTRIGMENSSENQRLLLGYSRSWTIWFATKSFITRVFSFFGFLVKYIKCIKE